MKKEPFFPQNGRCEYEDTERRKFLGRRHFPCEVAVLDILGNFTMGSRTGFLTDLSTKW